MIDLKLDRVSKRYRIRRDADADAPGGRLARALRSLRRPKEDFWAVRDVSFEVARGEALGIIGHNGAGKSTILKLLSNITTPTKGEITIRGRLSALIEVGSGFHPELSGRENVYLSGSILGMARREINAKLDSIVDFAGLRQFLDVPVKRYSSGMYVRLGFSIAAHLEPDILLLDEVLAVGDASFQQKCLERIDELKRAGTTIVFISHDLGAVARLCDRVLLMRRGEVVCDGGPHAVVAEYRSLSAGFSPSAPPATARLSKEAEISALDFRAHAPGAPARTGRPLTVTLDFVAREGVPDAVFEVFFYSADNELLCHLTTALGGARADIAPGAGRVEFFCPELVLLPGLYHVDATIILRGQPLGSAVDWQYHCAMLRVEEGDRVRGSFLMPHRARVTQQRGAPDEVEEGRLTLPL